MSFNMQINVPMYQQQYGQGSMLVRQAMMAEAMGQLPPAAQSFEQAAQWFDTSVASAQQLGLPIWDFAYFSCGYAHFNAARLYAQLGQWQATPPHLGQALAALNAAIGVNPRVGYYHSSAGMVLLAQGNTAEAERAFQTAIGLNPNDGWAQYMLAAIHAAQGNTAASTQMYSAAQAAMPGLPPVQQVLPASAPQLAPAPQPAQAPQMTQPARAPQPAQPRWMDILTKVATVADAVNKIGGAVNTVGGLMGGFNPGAASGMNAGMGWNMGMGNMGMGNMGMGWPGMRR